MVGTPPEGAIRLSAFAESFRQLPHTRGTPPHRAEPTACDQVLPRGKRESISRLGDMFQPPVPFENAVVSVAARKPLTTGPICAHKTISVRPSWSKSPANAPANPSLWTYVGMAVGWSTTRHEPSRLPNAMGMLVAPRCQIAISLYPSPSKSPTKRILSFPFAFGAKLPTHPFVQVQRPSPFENAMGTVLQPLGPVSAMSVFPSPLKSPISAFTSTVVAHAGKSWQPPPRKLVDVHVPSPFENAIGIPVQRCVCPPHHGARTAMSVFPSP